VNEVALRAIPARGEHTAAVQAHLIPMERLDSACPDMRLTRTEIEAAAHIEYEYTFLPAVVLTASRL